MIIDAHAHAFPSLHDHVGYASAEEHMRAAQVHVVAPSQPVIETATGRIVTEPTLSDGKGLGWSSLLDVNFRYGRYGAWSGRATAGTTTCRCSRRTSRKASSPRRCLR